MSETGQVTAAVVGLGDISAVHLEELRTNPRVRLVAVCDVDGERAERSSAQWGVPGFTDHVTMFEAVRPDVVHVTTPHHQHVVVALDAIKAGVHVLTEKPVAHTLTDAERLAAAAEMANVKVGLVLQNRYNPTSVAIREVLASGQLGTVQGGRAAVWWQRTPAYYAASPWRGKWSQGGGGVLINQAIHTLDLMTWFLGEPESIDGRAATVSLADTIEVEDTAAIRLRHPGGLHSVFFATNAHHTNAPVELEISGDNGSVAIERGEAVLTGPGGERRVLATDAAAGGERSYWGASHGRLIDDFYARLDEPEPFWLTPTTGLTALRVLRTVYAQSGLLPEGSEL